MIPPALIRIRVVESGRKTTALWLPIFLLWIPALAVAIAAIPLLLLLLLVSPLIPGVRKLLRRCYDGYRLLCCSKGLRVEVDGDDDEVFVDIR